MQPTLSILQKEKDNMTNQKKQENVEAAQTKEELLMQKARLDAKLLRIERKEIDDKVISSLRKLEDISESLGDLQNSLNLIWKRTEQVKEELRDSLKSN